MLTLHTMLISQRDLLDVTIHGSSADRRKSYSGGGGEASLRREEDALGNGPWGDLAWTYDKIGNRLSEIRDGTTTTYTYRPNAAGSNSPQLATTTPAGEAAIRYYFDAVGNQTHERRNDAGVRYSYDDAGRMSEILRDAANRAPSMTQLRYDGRGYLSRSTLTPFLGVGVREWVTRATYSSEGVLHHRAIERHPTPDPPRGQRSTVGDDYVFYFAGRPVGQLGLQVGGSAPTESSLAFLSADHLGTPSLISLMQTETGASVWSGGFEPFGAVYRGAHNSGPSFVTPLTRDAPEKDWTCEELECQASLTQLRCLQLSKSGGGG